ncbi:hypothetical protein SynA18461_01182 [Synechococcus sp. A18-46.1]|nr:hypothetical protein SynA18461_01182 [Synechococcus sp. A18-46.1]
MLNIFPVSNGGFFYCLLLLAGLPQALCQCHGGSLIASGLVQTVLTGRCLVTMQQCPERSE